MTTNKLTFNKVNTRLMRLWIYDWLNFLWENRFLLFFMLACEVVPMNWLNLLISINQMDIHSNQIQWANWYLNSNRISTNFYVIIMNDNWIDLLGYQLWNEIRKEKKNIKLDDYCRQRGNCSRTWHLEGPYLFSHACVQFLHAAF